MKKQPPFPSTRTCTIREMLDYASANHGKSKVERRDKIMREALGNITQLSKIDVMRWGERKWALKALKAIEAIGITERLALLDLPTQQQRDGFKESKAITWNQMGELASKIGLEVHRVGARVIVLRGKHAKTEDVPTCKADLA